MKFMLIVLVNLVDVFFRNRIFVLLVLVVFDYVFMMNGLFIDI